MITPASAEVKFIQWGEWVRGNESSSLKTNIIGRCMDEGAGASHSTVPGEAHMSQTVEVVERCVLVMPKVIRRVCMHRYVGQEPDYKTIKKLRCGQRTYENRINQAIHILIDFITENNFK